MMRELETVSPVVWPSWCYSGEGPTEADTNASNTSPASGQSSDQPVQTKPKAKRRHNSLTSKVNKMNGEMKDKTDSVHVKKEISTNQTAAAATTGSTAVKTERLSPNTANSAVNLDNNSNSSRSGTPGSSYPGTPPSSVTDRVTSPTHATQGHLKHMEQMMSRNYSDFMRSLAAKYNNSNPNDYFSSARNGLPSALESRFNTFKTSATPFVGLMAPLNASPSNNQSNQPQSTTTSPIEKQKTQELFQPNFGLNGINPFSTSSTGPLFPPMIDMSSTQALLNMVRSASAQNQVQLENYLKNNKRQSESSPLDLSSAAPISKKVKKELKDSYVDSLFNLPFLDVLRTKDLKKIRPGSVSPNYKKSLTSSSASSPAIASLQRQSGNRCGSICSIDGKSCSTDNQSITNWTVDDVCSFVSSIETCAEYEKNFREERIDGSSLPLLTEEHLTNILSMKLGPALKLRSMLSRQLGHCSICLHCVHCHGNNNNISSIAGAGTARPSSTGN